VNIRTGVSLVRKSYVTLEVAKKASGRKSDPLSKIRARKVTEGGQTAVNAFGLKTVKRKEKVPLSK